MSTSRWRLHVRMSGDVDKTMASACEDNTLRVYLVEILQQCVDVGVPVRLEGHVLALVVLLSRRQGAWRRLTTPVRQHCKTTCPRNIASFIRKRFLMLL